MADRHLDLRPYQVQAAMAGRLSQTRRVLKPQPDTAKISAPFHPEPRGGRRWVFMARDDFPTYSYGTADFRVPFAIGDRLWVREAFWRGEHDFAPDDIRGNPPELALFYKADRPRDVSWRSPIHMPRAASRLTLVVTDVRVQRVQDISEDDARAEGVEATRVTEAEILAMPLALPGFRSLWNRIHGPDAWDRNDWVAAVKFTVHKCNIDQMEKAND